MRFPDRLLVTARDRGSGLPVTNVALMMTLFAERKNDYSVGPQITDQYGEVRFTKADCEFAINQAKEMFVMDYHSSLKQCRPYIEVRLHSRERVSGMIKQYRGSPDFWGLAFREPERLMQQTGISAELRIRPLFNSCRGEGHLCLAPGRTISLQNCVMARTFGPDSWS
jgi:hypothetical protein